MAAATNKPTAVHYFLIAFVIFTIVFAVLWYNSFSAHSQAMKNLDAAKAEVNNANTALRKTIDDLDAVKKLLGKTQEPTNDPSNPNSVTGSMQADIVDKGRTEAETTYAGTLARLRQALDTALAELNSKTTQLAASEQERLALEKRYRDIADAHQKARATAEADLRTLVNERDEKLAAKDQEIASLRAQYNQAQVELEQEKEARAKERKQLQDENLRLVAINDKLREELDEIKAESFDVADGLITNVDNVSRIVWINLGDLDFLKPRMTFSVYSKDSPSVGRTAADIKGKIEVTRILNAHQAEAKMIEEDPFRPMAPGDLIFTPLWSPGSTERFAVVGKLDLDRDGQNDRELFHQEMKVRGAEISAEVDDDGERLGGPIDERTKFLILGAIPDLSEIVNAEERDKAQKIIGHLKDMRNEARLHGVRVVTLSDFLAFIGYKPKRRLFRPGQETTYNLKAGAASASVNQPLGDITSTGQVSGAFTKTKTTQQKTSTGQTSKLFGPGR
uniref:BRCT domain-containing protein n=1 Tax=Schlesneria paludicola TaxID=360056 RepID=A0A7C4QPU6_9PLAN